MRHYAFNVGDYAAATAHLSDAEDLAYRRLLDAYYAREAPLPADEASCCRLARATSPAARKAVGVVLHEFFMLGDDGWHQTRCDQEIARYVEKSEKARASGQRSGEVRRTNVERTLNERSANVELTTNHEPRTTTPTVPTPSATEPTGDKSVARERAPSRPKVAAKTPLPPDFAISDRVRSWATDKGHARLDERLEHFVGKAKANGYRYADWDEAFMAAIRDDWAKLDGKASAGVSRLTPAGQQTATALQRWVDDGRGNGTDGP